MAANGTVHLRNRGVGTLVKDLSGQVSTLVRQEVELAKAELAEKGKQAGMGAGILSGAAVAALMMLGSLTAFLILAFALIIPTWAAALIITALWGAAAGILAIRGRDALSELGKPVPEKTVETIKEDLQWLKDRN
jgi:uncharacterized membrane protein YqjE